MKVLHLIEGLGSGGAERVLYTNLKHLNSELIESEVVTTFSNRDHWKKPIQELGIKVSSLDCRSPKDIRRGISNLRAKIKETKPDVIHTHLWTANIIGRIAGSLCKIPVVSSVHSTDYAPEAISDGSQISASKRFFIRNLDNLTTRFACQKILAVSEYVKKSTSQQLGIALEEIEVLYNPIDISDLQPNASHRKSEFLRDELNVSADALILLSIARFSHQKGLIYAVRALPKIKEKFPNAHLVFAGSGDDFAYLTKIKNEIAALRLNDSVHFLGVRRDIPDLLQFCDVFVFPSLHEGLGIALIEAMAVGCPSVATRTGPIPEFVEHQVNGLLTAPKDAENLSENVCRLLANADERNRLGNTARETVLSKFQPQAASDKLTEIYFSMLRAKTV